MTSDLPPTGGQQPPPAPPSYPPAATTTAPGSARHRLDDFFDRIRATGAVRPDEGSWGPGVAAGLSRRLDFDVVFVRGVFVALSVLGGLGGAVYGLAWLLMPQEDGRIHLQEAIRGRFSLGFFGAAFLSLAWIGGGGPWGHGIWSNWGLPSLLLVGALVAGVYWLASSDRSVSAPPAAGYDPPPAYDPPPVHETPPAYGSAAYGGSSPATEPVSGWQGARNDWQTGMQLAKGGPRDGTTPLPPRQKSDRELARERSKPSKTIVRLTLGLALLAAATVLVIGNLADWSAPVGVIAGATALAVIGAGVIASGLDGRRAAGLISIGLLLAIGTLAGAGAHEAGIRAGQNLAIVGSQTWRPTTSGAADTEFNLGVGEATLWLTNPAILVGATEQNPLRIEARVGAGHLTVVVPDDVAARLEIQIGAGEVVRPDGNTTQVNGGRNNSGQVENLNTGPSSQPRIVVQIQQGVGQLEIKTATQAAGGSFTPTPTATATPTATPVSTPTPTPSAKKN